MADTLEQLQSHLSTLKNRAGQRIRMARDSTGTPVATAGLPVGRVVVAPGLAVEASEWGNTTYDQTVQVFANASTRSQQWPTPLEGARSWLMDSHSLWVYSQGKWASPAAGFVASAVGPATSVNCPSGQTTVLVSVPLTVVGQRRLLMTFYWYGTNTYVGSAWVEMVAYTTVLPGITYASGAGVAGSWATTRNLSGAGGNVFTVQLSASVSSGAGTSPINFAAHSCSVLVTDMGATS